MTTDPGMETLTAVQFAWEVLTGDPDLQALLGGPDRIADRVWEGAAPEGTASPWVTIQALESLDVKTGAGLTQIMAAVPLQVMVRAQASGYTDDQVAVWRRVHQLLEGTTSRPTGQGTILTCRRVSVVQFPERTNGVEYRHVGGTYETNTQ